MRVLTRNPPPNGTTIADEDYAASDLRTGLGVADAVANVERVALMYAAAGLLHYRPATTHWGELDTLPSLDDTIDVRRDQRFVDDGDVITSASVSAGIDMALHLIGRFSRRGRADEVRRGIQYEPYPSA